MRDVHCHILPGVDDGARNLDESVSMLRAAHEIGITSITCTPHVRDPYFDYDAMLDAYRLLLPYAQDEGIQLHMGWEVAHTKLVELGMEWASRLSFRGSNEFLLELPAYAQKFHFQEYERTIFQLQGMGLEVIIAHPERCLAIQQDISLAEDLVRRGCKLQASADFIAGGRFGKERKYAKRLFKEGLYSLIASDAHRAEHYRYFAKAVRTYSVEDELW